MNELTDLILQTTDPMTALLLLDVAAPVLWIWQNLHEDLCITRGRVRRVEDRAVATDSGAEEDDDGR